MFRVLVSLLIVALPAEQGSDATVRTTEGPVSGVATDGVRAFKGIPYAAPWKDTREANAYAPICIQPGGGAANSFYGGSARARVQSEDCLYLNVWTTGPESAQPRPVMMWIHGGGMLAGSATNPEYDGANPARKGVVVVTVGYRLGVLGFLALPDLSAESPLDALRKNRESGTRSGSQNSSRRPIRTPWRSSTGMRRQRLAKQKVARLLNVTPEDCRPI